MILTILFCDLLWRIKCPRTEFPTASLDITVYQFVSSSSSCYSTVRPSDALDLKARVKQKGRISPMWSVGKVPACIIYVRENLSTFKIYFSLCVILFFVFVFLLKISDAYQFIFILFY